MESSRLVFSLAVGFALLLFGSVVASKASIGMSLIAIGLALIATTLASGKWQASQSAEPAMLRVSPEKPSQASLAPQNNRSGAH